MAKKHSGTQYASRMTEFQRRFNALEAEWKRKMDRCEGRAEALEGRYERMMGVRKETGL